MSTHPDHKPASATADIDTESTDKKNSEHEKHEHVSIGDMISGTAVQELTPFERKAALINA
jgi:hypothetical protein